MRRFTIIILLLFIHNLCFSQNPTNHFPKHSTEDLKEDYAELRKHIETKNPITYLYESKEHITSYLDSIEQLIDKPMTELDFYRLISPIASLTRDGHNLIMPSAEMISFLEEHPRVFPLQMTLFNNELIIIENDSENQELKPKYKINSINGISSNTILERLYLVLPREGYQTQITASHISKWFRFFYHLNFGFEEKYNIQYSNLKGKIEETIVYGKTLDEIKKKRKENKPEEIEDKGIYVEIIDDVSKIARLNVPTFSPLFLKRLNQKKFKKEIDQCFDIISQNDIQHLIIDIRKNGGGNPVYAVYLLKHLFDKRFTNAIEGRVVKHSNKEKVMERTSKKWFPLYGIGTFKPKKKAYSGAVYVLTSGGTFSAAVEFASTLKKYNRAVFIGEETGGNPIIMTGNYLKESRKLPNTKITHYSGSICTIYNDLEKNDGRGLIPGYEIKPNIDDLILRKDVVLEKALLVINEK